MAVIEVDGLVKRYGDVTAVDGIRFSVEAGEVFALLGPNGAGKTTTVEILEGFKTRDAGAVNVLGIDPARSTPAWRDRIGIVLQQSGIDREATVSEILRHFSRYYRTPRSVDELIELVGLSDKASSRVKALSGGQRRRLDLALGILGQPDLLFLDEPTTGFDPSARRNSWSLIADLAGGGTTVILTTHYLDEAQFLADRVAVIRSGKIVAEGDPDSIGGRDTAHAVISFRLPGGVSVADLALDANASFDDGLVSVSTDQPTRHLAKLTAWAVDRGIELEALTVTRPSLEDMYLQLVGTEGAE